MKQTGLQYLLEDILEIKFRKGAHANRKLASRLVQKSKGCRRIRSVNSFALGDMLLIIKNGETSVFRKLVLLDAHTRAKTQVQDLDRLSKPLD